LAEHQHDGGHREAEGEERDEEEGRGWAWPVSSQGTGDYVQANGATPAGAHEQHAHAAR
jgi:hypothetical protein